MLIQLCSSCVRSFSFSFSIKDIAAFLAQRCLALTSIKLYLASVCHMQVSMGYPEPRAASSLPQLRLVLNGISCARVTLDVRHGVSQLRDLSFTSGNGSSLTKRLFILKVRELLYSRFTPIIILRP